MAANAYYKAGEERLNHRNDSVPNDVGRNDRLTLTVLSALCVTLGFFPNYGLSILSVLVFIVILGKGGIESAICAYVYLSIWGKFTTLPVFSGISLISVILSLYIFLHICRNKVKIRFVDFLLLFIVFFEGVHSVLFTKTTSGIFLVFDLMIIIYINSVLTKDENRRKEFYTRLFLYLYVSTVFSIFWGVGSYLAGKGARLYLHGQYFRRFQSTVGTDRSCMIYCSGLIYPLYYMKNKALRIGSVFGMMAALLMSFSITAILCAGVFFTIYLYDQYRSNRDEKKLWITLGILALIAYLIYIWYFGSHIGPINTIVRRVQLILARLNSGDVARATSGRSDILSNYRAIFNSLPLSQKLLGSGVTTFYGFSEVENFSHNTYLDLEMYFGLIPTLFIFWRLIHSIRIRRNDQQFTQILLLKTAYILTAFSVSMLTNNYWWAMFLI